MRYETEKALQKEGHPGILRVTRIEPVKDTITLHYQPSYGSFSDHIFMESMPWLVPSLVAAVAFCHRKRVAIRDLNPANIVFPTAARDQVALYNFSNAIRDTALSTRRSLHHHSLLFLPPELCHPTTIHYNAYQGDVWTLGVIIYAMYTTKHPFFKSGQSNYDLLQSIRSAIVVRDDRVPDLVYQMLHRDPSQRPSLLCDQDNDDQVVPAI